jgi:muconolactone delta-isomerase
VGVIRVVAPTSESIRGFFPRLGPEGPPSNFVELVGRARQGAPRRPSFCRCLRALYREAGYDEDAISSILGKASASVGRYDNAFRLFVELTGLMGFSFLEATIPQMVSVLAVLARVSPSQARSAYSAILLCPGRDGLRYNAVVKGLRAEWAASTPRYASFFSGAVLLERLAAASLDWSSRTEVRARLVLVWRLLGLFRSYDLFNVRRAVSELEGKHFVLVRRKGWQTFRWERIISLPNAPELSPWHLFAHYVALCPKAGGGGPTEPPPLLVAVTAPFSPISANRIGSITAEQMAKFGVPADFKPHATRGIGLNLLVSLGLKPEEACEIGSWKNFSAFRDHYLRLGAVDRLSERLANVVVFLHMVR